jgi:Na+/H+ antiporter NhaD/arsenite permease-like protein
MASTLAGNLTITESVADIILVGQAKDVAPIGFRDYLVVGSPVTFLTLAFGFLWLWLID